MSVSVTHASAQLFASLVNLPHQLFDAMLHGTPYFNQSSLFMSSVQYLNNDGSLKDERDYHNCSVLCSICARQLCTMICTHMHTYTHTHEELLKFSASFGLAFCVLA